jgi:hypothetical protein
MNHSLRPWLAPWSAWLLLGSSTQAGVAPFSEEAAARGVVYTIQDYPQADGYLGFGCAILDLDDDGDQDLVILGATGGRVGVFENDGQGLFTDRSESSGIPAMPSASGLAAGDYDGDGLLDLYLTQVGEYTRFPQSELFPNLLLHNDGGLQFTEVGVHAGVDDLGAGKGAAFGDYDGDGWLDLFVSNYNGIVTGTEQLNDKLYRNLGNGTFDDVSASQGVDSDGFGFQAVWFDYDLDGDVDLYLSNDRGHINGRPNQFWRNDSGRLVNVSAESGTQAGLFSMGIGCGDLDGNGWPDLHCTNISGYDDDVGGVFPLFLNQSDGTFTESSVAAGVDVLDSPRSTGWGSIVLDYDNDGHPDLYVNLQFEPNRLFTGGGTFPLADIAPAVAATGSAEPSFSSAAGDVDGDGDLDLLLNNLSGAAELLINHEGEKRNWIRYRMAGQAPNHWAVGGRTHTRTGTQWQLREILAGGNSYLGQNELIMHIGLGSAPQVDELMAVWPGGRTTRMLTRLPANRSWTLYPPERLGDTDGDGAVGSDDFAALLACYDMPFEPGCEVMDFDGDSDVDAQDSRAFIEAFSPAPEDCNHNGQADLLDILADPASDADRNGVLDAADAAGRCRPRPLREGRAP